MNLNYNLVKRQNPADLEKKSMLWYAAPAYRGVKDEDETAREATVDTTISKAEFKHVMEVASEKLIPSILSGISVTIGKIGKLRISFGSEGVENMADFDPQTMIKNVKFIFTPSSELKSSLTNLSFELAGIVEDGVKYGTKQSYMKAKGILPDGSTTEQAIQSGRDGATGAENSTATRGGDYIVKGPGIMALGEDGAADWRVGLTSSMETTTYAEVISTNTPNLVIFTVPNDLTEDTYTLTIETYYSPTGTRKEPITLTAPFTLTLV
ncbi:hypothetical protein B5F77_06230 [Parabacteroides sp. An277]|uniref:HU family DNA-binding protein n=1 Tax=Parabacteroides sp. An277 TaxID=1965619 RepID=UPI000B366FFD|nr:DUF4469 domain-containing protein [Parabacteroides sp. An277]OUO53390.1 hypothetical protein B5F77_06230 [Parabacteroides sp. An277]